MVWHKTLRTLILVVLVVLFFALQLFFVLKKSQTLSFSDESEHLTQGAAVLNSQRRLYVDLSTNHQPLPILAAIPIISLSPPANLFMTIERTRQLMWLFSLIGAVALTLRFKWTGLLATILLETSKFYLLGFYILAESLVLYPLMYLMGILLELSLKKTKTTTSFISDLAWGLATFIVAFSLLPAWPFLVAATICYCYLTRSWRSLVITALSFFILTGLLFSLVSPLGWLQETILNNFHYFLPYETTMTVSSLTALVLYPLLHVVTPGSLVSQLYIVLVVVSAVSLVLLYKNTTNKHSLLALVGVGYALLILINPRVTATNIAFFTAFHALPQLAVLCLLTVGLSWEALERVHRTHYFRTVAVFYFLALALFLFSATHWWRESLKTDKQNDHFIAYGQEASAALVLTTLKNSSDTLLAGPQSFLNLASGIALASRQTAFLPWAHRSAALRQEFLEVLTLTPPSFIAFSDPGSPYYPDLLPHLTQNYVQFYRSFGGSTGLYIRRDRLTSITPEQKARLDYLLYTLSGN